jgi:hypothetical protein
MFQIVSLKWKLPEPNELALIHTYNGNNIPKHAREYTAIKMHLVWTVQKGAKPTEFSNRQMSKMLHINDNSEWNTANKNNPHK